MARWTYEDYNRDKNEISESVIRGHFVSSFLAGLAADQNRILVPVAGLAPAGNKTDVIPPQPESPDISSLIQRNCLVTTEIKTWIRSTQFSDDGYFAPTGFEQSVTLYETRIGFSFVLAMINGTAKPATFSANPSRSQYDQLIDAVRSVTDDQKAFWFFGTDPDNALSFLSWVRECNYELAVEYNLNCFENSPAEEGGVSWLGLVASNKQWMLLHEHNPCNDFTIKFHGTAALCDAIVDLLKV